VHLKTRPASAMLYRYQVWNAEGALVLRSHEAPNDRPMTELTQFGFGNARLGGEDFRIYSLPSRDGRMVVQVAECIDERVEQVGVVTARYVAFLLLPFGLILAATWLLLRRSLRSLGSIAVQLKNRNPLDVTQLDVDRPPEEIMPIVKSLDAMFKRVRQAISVERRFTSMAAHEMRTPLAGLRAHAQLATVASSAEESKEALHAVIQGVDRAAHLLSQLLDIARVEGIANESSLRFQQADLSLISADALSDVLPAAVKKNVTVQQKYRVKYVEGMPFGLFLILRNLLANAVLYCPPGGVVQLTTSLEAGRTTITVDDSGPGIAPEDRERAFERFNRLGQHQTEGVGLGLSIVLMVVELHDAKISLLDSPLGGLRCHIVFSAPTSRPDKFGARQLAPA
jgi:signal transduction histidine kinase